MDNVMEVVELKSCPVCGQEFEGGELDQACPFCREMELPQNREFYQEQFSALKELILEGELR